MQTDSQQMVEEEGESRGRGSLIGITAAVAVILVAGLVFFLTRDNASVAEPAPNAIPLAEDFEFIDPGAYYADTDGDESTSLRGTFVIEGEEWQGLGAGAAKWRVDNGPYIALFVTEIDQVGAPACVAGSTPQPAATTAEGLANQFVASGLTVTEALAPVSAFGQEGYHLSAQVPAGCHSNEALNVWSGPTWGGRYYQTENQPLEFWFLEVEGTPVMVEASWFPESTEEEVSELRAVLDTLVITP